MYRLPPEMFPFLIGRIRTKMPEKFTGISMEFPFLIGRIRTAHSIFHALIATLVSIPHR